MAQALAARYAGRLSSGMGALEVRLRVPEVALLEARLAALEEIQGIVRRRGRSLGRLGRRRGRGPLHRPLLVGHPPRVIREDVVRPADGLEHLGRLRRERRQAPREAIGVEHLGELQERGPHLVAARRPVDPQDGEVIRSRLALLLPRLDGVRQPLLVDGGAGRRPSGGRALGESSRPGVLHRLLEEALVAEPRGLGGVGRFTRQVFLVEREQRLEVREGRFVQVVLGGGVGLGGDRLDRGEVQDRLFRGCAGHQLRRADQLLQVRIDALERVLERGADRVLEPCGASGDAPQVPLVGGGRWRERPGDHRPGPRGRRDGPEAVRLVVRRAPLELPQGGRQLRLDGRLRQLWRGHLRRFTPVADHLRGGAPARSASQPPGGIW